MTDLRGNLLAEADHLRRVALFAAERHYAAETPWFYSVYWFNLPVMVLSAIAGLVAFMEFPWRQEVAASISMIVAALAALATYLDPRTKANQHHALAKAFESLYHEIGLYSRVLAVAENAERKDLWRIKAFTKEFLRLMRSTPPVPARIYRRARKNLASGKGEVAKHAADLPLSEPQLASLEAQSPVS